MHYSTGIVLMGKEEIVDDVKRLDKNSQIEVVRSLLQQLEPEVVSEAAKDAAMQINLGSNNTNGSTINYSDIVINLYFGDNQRDLDVLTNLLDAAAFRLRNKKIDQLTLHIFKSATFSVHSPQISSNS